MTALAALGESERIVPLFLEGLVFPDKAERLDASAATPLFLEALSHPSKDVRAQSAECLGVVGGRARYQNAPRAAGILEGLARDDAAPRVRAEILTAMVRIAPESEDVAARLLAALGDENPTVRQRAASAIKALPVSDKIVLSVTAALEDPDASVRTTAAATLGDLGQAAASAVEALVELTDDPDRAVRVQAVRALGRIGELAHEAAPVLWHIAHEPDDGLAEDAWFALEFLHAIGPSQTTRKVMFFLFALTGVSAAWLMRRLWFHGIGGRGTRWMMATSAAFAIILGWELLEARAQYPYERPGFLERIDTIPFATNDLVLAIGNPRGHEDAFGYALAAMPDALGVGTLDDGAYIYEPSGELRARLDRPDSDGDDFFGSQVAAAGTNVVVAAPQDDQIVRDAGAVFLFDGATGELRTRIDNPTPLVRELFGEAVAASDDRILVCRTVGSLGNGHGRRVPVRHGRRASVDDRESRAGTVSGARLVACVSRREPRRRRGLVRTGFRLWRGRLAKSHARKPRTGLARFFWSRGGDPRQRCSRDRRRFHLSLRRHVRRAHSERESPGAIRRRPFRRHGRGHRRSSLRRRRHRARFYLRPLGRRRSGHRMATVATDGHLSGTLRIHPSGDGRPTRGRSTPGRRRLCSRVGRSGPCSKSSHPSVPAPHRRCRLRFRDV